MYSKGKKATPRPTFKNRTWSNLHDAFDLEREEVSASSRWELDGCKSRSSGPPARGYVQITGKSNYQTWSDELGVDLVRSPNLAATPDIAAQIAVEGTDRGSFRHRVSFYDYINPSGTDFFNARDVKNGDKNTIRRGATVSNGNAIANSATSFAGLLAGCR